jgi:translation initiation factor eIF-2B subunit beta
MAPSSDVPELTSSDPAEVRAWLKVNHSTKLLATLDKFEIELRLGRLTFAADPTGSLMDEDGLGGSGNSSGDVTGSMHAQGTTNRRLVTRRTVELFKVLIGSARWKTGAQLMLLLKGLGKELHAAGGHREPAIGNVVRRIMSCVREEVDRHAQEVAAEEHEIGNVAKRLSENMNISSLDESSMKGSMNVSFADSSIARDNTPGSSSSAKIQRNLSLASMLWAHPQHVTVKRTGSGVKSGSGSGGGPAAGSDRMRSNSFGNEHGLSSPANKQSNNRDAIFLETLPESFHVVRSDLRVSIMEAIQEIANDLEDLYKNIIDQATSHIHADEVILTYGRSKTIELVSASSLVFRRSYKSWRCSVHSLTWSRTSLRFYSF